LNSELLYGSNDRKNDNSKYLNAALLKEAHDNEIYVIDHLDHKDFNTFGDSENNNKVTAVSELHSPDNRMHSPNP
jgi:hypothetical protein